MKTDRSSAAKALLMPVMAFILCFALTFTVLSAAAQADDEGSPAFTDVPASHWAYNDITEAASLGFINGYGDGRFGPNDPLTREQWIALVTRVIGATAETGDHMHTFSTTNASAWAIPELVKAENMGLFQNGLDNIWRNANRNGVVFNSYTELNYKAPIERAEAASVVAGAFAWLPFNDKSLYTHYYYPTNTGDQFPDLTPANGDNTYRWGNVRTHVGICANAGIINGYPDGNFGPKNTLTRAEAAAILMRMYRVVPADCYTLKTAADASVTWKTDKYGTHCTLHSPYADIRGEYTSGKSFDRNSPNHYLNLSHHFYVTKEEYDFVNTWLVCYHADNSFGIAERKTLFNLGILEWNDPNDHSKGAHGKYGVEFYNAVTNHDDEALKELIVRIEHDHAENLALYDAWVAAGKPVI